MFNESKYMKIFWSRASFGSFMACWFVISTVVGASVLGEGIQLSVLICDEVKKCKELVASRETVRKGVEEDCADALSGLKKIAKESNGQVRQFLCEAK